MGELTNLASLVASGLKEEARNNDAFNADAVIFEPKGDFVDVDYKGKRYRVTVERLWESQRP